MVILDFGPSPYAENSPCVSWEQMRDYGKIDIPNQGLLTPINDEEYRNQVKDARVGISHPSVEPQIIYLHLKGSGCPDELLLVWIKERKEWIGIEHSEWLESSAWGGDESYKGPHALDEKYARKILEAYGIPEEILSPKNILRIEPSDLEKLVSKK